MKLNWIKFQRSYAALGKDVVLCCYEDVRIPNEWCHRLVFAEWWAMKTGEIIPELKDESSIKNATTIPAQQEILNKATVSESDKILIKIVYSLWTDKVEDKVIYQGSDIYYEANPQTRKVVRRLTDKEARNIIAEGRADFWTDYDSVAKVRFILSDKASCTAYLVDKKGKEKNIDFRDAVFDSCSTDQ